MPLWCASTFLQVEYIFSDKTGTLTSNEMQLRQIAVKGVAYGSNDVRLEEHMDKTGLRALRFFDQRLYRAAARAQRSSSWTGLITAGGSRRDIMAHPTSYPNLESASSMGLEPTEENVADDSTANGTEGEKVRSCRFCPACNCLHRLWPGCQSAYWHLA